MTDLFELTQKALENPSELQHIINELHQEQQRLTNVELAQLRACLRLLLTHQSQKQSGQWTIDYFPLIRQVSRHFGNMRIPSSLWDVLPKVHEDFGLRVQSYDNKTVIVTAIEWSPNWLPDAYDIDRLGSRRTQTLRIGDSILYNMMRSDRKEIMTYQSEGQRRAVQSTLMATPGSTTLITLPTGSGKSLCTYLPAWITSKGGQGVGGTTLVIVPTVALAIDQEENARKFFRGDNPLYLPHHLSSGIEDKKRAIIREGVKNGSIPLLFISPESLLGSEFKNIFLEVAEMGYLSQVVIDEAHLIETWGASFRTDFQLISAYLRKLHKISGNNLRIILLSATISDSAYRTLKQLFTLSTGEFIHIQVNQLRPEINYWMVKIRPGSDKYKYLSEALKYLPRPAIVYYTSPEDAEGCKKFLQKEGYERITTFTGKTNAQDRIKRIRDWRNNLIDLMIATSAFGLGVDKPDVRTIIHATFPENINRFYQEVGRGGRDGCSAISLLIASDKDKDIALNMASKSLITSEVAWSRWENMFENGRKQGHDWIINRQSIRETLQRPSDKNVGWNEHVLLLMQRANIIQIIDPLESNDQAESLEYDEICLKVLNSDAVNMQHHFIDAFERVRNTEKEEIYRGCLQLVTLFDEQVATSDRCIAHSFASVYDPVSLACGGCPACRRSRRLPYAYDTSMDITPPPLPHFRIEPKSALKRFMGGSSLMNLTYDSVESILQASILEDLISGLIDQGIQQLILEPFFWETKLEDFIRKTPHPNVYQPHVILGTNELRDIEPYNVPTVVVFSNREKNTDREYQILSKWQKRTNNYLIYVIPYSLELSNLNGRFVDRVNAPHDRIQRFLTWLKNEKSTL